MFKIGDFSRFTRVSVKTLRHYDEVGLLRPRVVDRFTNYRYYSADQVPRLNQILALRELGFSLEQIGRLLEAALSPEQLRGMFVGKRTEIVERIRADEEQLGRVEAYLAQLAQAASTPHDARYDVVVRSVAPGLVGSVRAWVANPSDDGPDIATDRLDNGQGDVSDQVLAQAVAQSGAEPDVVGAIFEALEQYVARFKARAPLPPAIIYHDQEYRADGQDLEIVVPLTTAIPTSDQIQVYEMPGCATMACLIHQGGYEDMGATFGALLQWVELNRYTIAGPMREVFLRFGANQAGYALPESYVTAQAHEWVTELQVPVVREEGAGVARGASSAPSTVTENGKVGVTKGFYTVGRTLQMYQR